MSLIRGQISADPAFITGLILISLAVKMSAAGVVVNNESRLTFHLVVSQNNDCIVIIEPAHTNVHSDPAMYLL